MILTDVVVVAVRRTLAAWSDKTVAAVARLSIITDVVVVAVRRTLAAWSAQTVATFARLIFFADVVLVAVSLVLAAGNTVAVRARAVLRGLADVVGHAALVRARGQAHALHAVVGPASAEPRDTVGGLATDPFPASGHVVQAITTVHVAQRPRAALTARTARRLSQVITHGHAVAGGRALVVAAVATSHVIVAHPLAVVLGQAGHQVGLLGTDTVLALGVHAKHAARVAHVAKRTAIVISERVRKRTVRSQKLGDERPRFLPVAARLEKLAAVGAEGAHAKSRIDEGLAIGAPLARARLVVLAAQIVVARLVARLIDERTVVAIAIAIASSAAGSVQTVAAVARLIFFADVVVIAVCRGLGESS
jgi:hypothetical protein